MALSREGYLIFVLFFTVLVVMEWQWGTNLNNGPDDIVALSDEINATCPTGYYKCETIPYCILKRLQCDGTLDCRDMSDEIYCDKDHSTRYKDGSPWGECKLHPINADCTCKEFDIYCRNRGLSSLPSNLPKKYVLRLDLTGNNFPSIDEKFLYKLPPMNELILINCRIRFIGPNAFKRLSVVVVDRLLLGENSIESFNQTIFHKRNTLRMLILSRNKLKELHDYDFLNLGRLLDLDLSYNNLQSIDAKVFEPLISLQYLYLNENYLTQLDYKMFSFLKGLDSISLSGNPLNSIQRRTYNFPLLDRLSFSNSMIFQTKPFTLCTSELTIDYRLHRHSLQTKNTTAIHCVDKINEVVSKDNEFRKLSNQAVEQLTFFEILFLRYAYTCYADPDVEPCNSEAATKLMKTPVFRQVFEKYPRLCDGAPYLEECKFKKLIAFRLLRSSTFRQVAWALTFLTIVGNVLMFAHELTQNTYSKSGHSLYLRNLAFSGIIMGIYMGIIAFVDSGHHIVFAYQEIKWRTGYLCTFTGILNSWSCLTSILLLPAGAWDRMMLMVRPYLPKSETKKSIATLIAIVWSVAFVLAVIPLMPIEFFGTYFGQNGFCLPLHIHNPYTTSWQYSIMLSAGVNSLSLMFVISCCVGMCCTPTNPRMRPTSRESARARRFAIILAINSVLSVPIIVIQMAVLTGVPFQDTIYPWLAFVILPITAIVNPFAYALITALSSGLLRPNSPRLHVQMELMERNEPKPEIDPVGPTSCVEQPSTSRRSRRLEQELMRAHDRTTYL